MITRTISIDVEYLFNLVNQKTLYIADQVDPDLNEKMIGKIAITLDEYDAFKVFMRRGAMEAFKALSRLAFDTESPFGYIRDDNNKDVSIFYKLAFKDEVQANIAAPIITDHIQRAIVAYVVKEWLRTKHLNSNYYSLDQEEYDYCLRELRSLRGYSNRAKTGFKYM